MVDKQIGGGAAAHTAGRTDERLRCGNRTHIHTGKKKKKETQQAFLVVLSGYALPVLFSRNSLSLWHIIPQCDYA